MTLNDVRCALDAWAAWREHALPGIYPTPLADDSRRRVPPKSRPPQGVELSQTAQFVARGMEILRSVDGQKMAAISAWYLAHAAWLAKRYEIAAAREVAQRELALMPPLPRIPGPADPEPRKGESPEQTAARIALRQSEIEAATKAHAVIGPQREQIERRIAQYREPERPTLKSVAATLGISERQLSDRILAGEKALLCWLLGALSAA